MKGISKAFALLYGTEGRLGRVEFLLAELFRGAALTGCYFLYKAGWVLLAAGLVWLAIWPGVVGTIKRFRDLGHRPIWILPVLAYLSVGFAAGYVYKQPAIGLVTLGIYLCYVLGFKGKQEGLGEAAAG